MREGACWARADFNGDGKVGIADLIVLADMYGSRTAAPAAVPEPATGAWIVIGMLAALRRRCRN